MSMKRKAALSRVLLVSRWPLAVVLTRLSAAVHTAGAAGFDHQYGLFHSCLKWFGTVLPTLPPSTG
jgi:hypothetical protein